ncbi:MAG: GTPase G3E family [Candidatus Methanohalarchaeum thermophilum]|uniref:GTPase G3E family n=1 Tax=Methanohalarchaeum thermophilum TaxID=1903181 RepID=A0A1Q6DVL9_METT1|nr:MAG: GTPase G3E family [Candidatus Methanohalarchaeum thermophilum]
MFETNFVIVTGFLGTGKTTFIIELAKRLTEEKDKKINILVNDFGQIAIDGETLNDFGMEAKRITKGCVCCEVKQDLVAQIRDLKKNFEPDIIILETSGVASLLPIYRTVEQYVDEIETLTLIDVSRYDKLMEKFRTVENQLTFADRILINKIDLADDEEMKKIEEKVSKFLNKENPDGQLHKISARKKIGLENVVSGIVQ